jgi:DNA anti-recombination protein RmuC
MPRQDAVDDMTLVSQLLVLILTPSAVIGVMAYLLKEFFSRALARDLEQYKSELRRQNHVFRTRFSLLHEKRAEVISEFYARMVRAVDQLQSLTAVLRTAREESLSDQKKETVHHLRDMSQFFSEHRLYFEESAAAKVESLIEVLRESFAEFAVAQPGEEIEHGPGTHPDMWQSAYERVIEEVPPIKRELEDTFRGHLHVEESES